MAIPCAHGVVRLALIAALAASAAGARLHSPSLEDIQAAARAAAPADGCDLEGVTRDLGKVWHIVSQEGKRARDADITPHDFEVATYCARHHFARLEELSEKIVKSTTAQQARGEGSKFGWSSRVCQILGEAAAEKESLFGDNRSADALRCGGWQDVASTLRLAPLSSCMRKLSDQWWQAVAPPVEEVCRVTQNLPSSIGFAEAVAQSAVPAAMALPRLQDQVKKYATQCSLIETGAREGTKYQRQACKILILTAGAHRFDQKRTKVAKSLGKSWLPADLKQLRMLAGAIADAAPARGWAAPFADRSAPRLLRARKWASPPRPAKRARLSPLLHVRTSSGGHALPAAPVSPSSSSAASSPSSANGEGNGEPTAADQFGDVVDDYELTEEVMHDLLGARSFDSEAATKPALPNTLAGELKRKVSEDLEASQGAGVSAASL